MLTVENLHPYQRYVANAILKNDNLMVCLDMGLGKTASVLSATEYLQRERGFKSALILAPLRVCYSVYPDEIKKWHHLQRMTHHIIHGKGKVKDFLPCNLYISNYETLAFLEKIKIWQKCDILIIDESTAIKNSKTKRFKTLKRFAPKFKKRICMTGTPSPSGKLLELWSQVSILDQGKRLGKSFWQFRNRYYDSDFMGYNYDLKPHARRVIQNKLKDITIMMRAQDYLTMPDRIKTVVPFNLPDDVRETYNEMEKEFIVEFTHGAVTAANAAVMSSKLRQITAGALYNNDGEYTLLHTLKIETLKEICEGVSGPVLCGFQFKFEKRLISRMIPEAKFIDGETPVKETQDTIKQWNAGKIKPLLCCQPASTGHGLNLQAGGNKLVWLSQDWSLERSQQFEARIYRQGQERKVFIYTIAARDTIDEAVAERLVQKSTGQNQLINALKTYIDGKR